MLIHRMKIILNEVTNTIHKQGTGRLDLQTVCGATNHVPQDNLRCTTVIESEIDRIPTSKCGRCFDDGGGY